MPIPIVREFDDLAENIALPPPNRPIARAVGNFGRKVCDAVSANPKLYAPSILQTPILAVCQPYFDGQGYDPPTEEPPFLGGQCVFGYNFEIQETVNPGPQPAARIIAVGAGGPISQAAIAIVAGNAFRIEGVGRFGFFASNNQPFGPNFVSAKVLRAIPSSGQGDVCGNPQPVLAPGPNPAPNPGPLPPGTGFGVGPRGEPIFILPPSLPGSDGGPGDTIINFPPGEVNLGSGTGNTAPGEPLPGSEVDGAGNGTGGGDNDFGDPPPGERWVGCCIRITARPMGHGSIPQAEPESIFPDVVGNVRLKFGINSNLPDYDTPLINKQKTTCVWEPVRGLQPVGVRVNLRPGFEYFYVAYSVPLEN